MKLDSKQLQLKAWNINSNATCMATVAIALVMPHHLHAGHTATYVAHIMVCVLGIRINTAKNGWINRDAIWGGGADSRKFREPCISWGSRLDETIRRHEGWQDNDVAYYQITLDTCYRHAMATNSIGHNNFYIIYIIFAVVCRLFTQSALFTVRHCMFIIHHSIN